MIEHGVIDRPSVTQSPREIDNIVIPGIIRPIKGYEYAIDALQYIEDVTLRIVGNVDDDEYHKSLVEKSKELEVNDRIDWDLRYIPESELFEIIKDADLILLPYNLDTSMSGILSHCISWKNITIVSDAPALVNTIQCEHAVVKQNGETISQRISELQSSPKMQLEILDKMSELSKRYSWDHTAIKTKEKYK
ncbi:glycosyltransferase [Haloferax volcanii]|uniref:glycosyltransferase n=1 Tax=Haloferax volcanii TaxID=2246 RepID=UPI0016437FA4|nr:glycosyltransferase [Haloferax volcanii]